MYDPGLHLFVDDAEVQDHPGFVRRVQQPARLQAEPVLAPDRPWEGESVQAMGGVLFDDGDGLFRMWYRALNSRHFGDPAEGGGNYLCCATSADGVRWDRPELGVVAYQGSRANNIVYPTPGADEMDPWGIVAGVAADGQRRYRMGFYQERPAQVPCDQKSPQGRKAYLRSILDRHGMYTAESADGIRWTLGEGPAVPRAGDAGAMGYDPIRQQYLATSRRVGTIADHFVLEWKQYRRVIALSTSPDFVHWTPMRTILKPDDLDDPGDQLYVMPAFAYGNQYLGFLCRYRTQAELGTVELAAARDLDHWERVGRREDRQAPPGPQHRGQGPGRHRPGHPAARRVRGPALRRPRRRGDDGAGARRGTEAAAERGHALRPAAGAGDPRRPGGGRILPGGVPRRRGRRPHRRRGHLGAWPGPDRAGGPAGAAALPGGQRHQPLRLPLRRR